MEMSTIGALITIGVMLFILLLVNIDLMRMDRKRAVQQGQEHVTDKHSPVRPVGRLRADFEAEE